MNNVGSINVSNTFSPIEPPPTFVLSDRGRKNWPGGGEQPLLDGFIERLRLKLLFKYSGPKISLHGFENAAAAPLPFAVCLTAIFAKICGKTLNPGQTLFGSTVYQGNQSC